MSCNNCFTGCTDITPDKCIRYTGSSISSLGIANGDTLLSVVNNITTNLLASLSGEGIVPVVDVDILCTLVTTYLPVSGDITIVDYIVALIKAVCSLQTQTTANTDAITALNADYDISCLSGVTNSSDTHDVVQAIITKLCTLSTSFSSLVATLPTTYVSLTDLNDLIQSYLDSIAAGTDMKNRMVPNVAMPYFGSLSYFDATGAGTGTWDQIYLCNGANGTPDLRGRVIVSVTDVVGGGAYDSAVDPGISGNPNYALNGKAGENNVTLTTAQLASHSHATSVSLNDSGHYHETVRDDTNDITLSSTSPIKVDSTFSADYTLRGTSGEANIGKTSTDVTGITATVTNPTAGSGDSHNNIQPVYAANFIIYIPS